MLHVLFGLLIIAVMLSFPAGRAVLAVAAVAFALFLLFAFSQR